MDDYDFEMDLAAEAELFDDIPAPAPVPTPPPAKKQRVKKATPIENCIDRAKHMNHKFLYKQGNLNSNNYLTAVDAFAFWKEYEQIPFNRRAAFEIMQEDQPVKFYLDTEHKELTEEPTAEMKRQVVLKTVEFLNKLLGVNVEGFAWDGTRKIKREVDGAERWKLSLHFNCSNIVCANLAQAEHIYDGLDDIVKRNPEWSKFAYYESQDKKGKKETLLHLRSGCLQTQSIDASSHGLEANRKQRQRWTTIPTFNEFQRRDLCGRSREFFIIMYHMCR